MIKRIIAWIGIVILVALYISTLVFALSNRPNALNLLMISIVLTVIIPIAIWLYGTIYDRIKQRRQDYNDQIPPEN